MVDIADIFDKYASQYDADHRRLLPCYQDLYGVAVEILPFNEDRELRVLDIGAGTGALSLAIAARYPRAQFTLVDCSEKMLRVAEKRFAQLDMARVSCHCVDYATHDFRGTYDLVGSALSIHHLEHPQKRSLFNKIYQVLEAGGLFVNIEQIQGENRFADQVYRRNWLSRVTATGISTAALDAARERMAADRCARLSDQLSWLEHAGFAEITTWYQYYCFAVYSGAKAV